MESTGTPTSAQDSTSNSQSIRSKTDPAWEHVYEEMCSNGRKALTSLHCKKVTKGGGIHRMKLHLAGVKGDIVPCKSVPPNVKYRMENSLQEIVKSKKLAQATYEFENPYGPNVLQFEGDPDEQQGEEEVQQMPNPTRLQMSGKRKKKQQWISTLHQELLKGLSLPLRVHLPGKKQFGE